MQQPPSEVSFIASSVGYDVRSIRRPPAICRDSWEFRKLCAEGSVFPNGFLVADIDDDGTEEFLIGTTEGQLLIMMPGTRNPLFLASLAATVSVVLHSPKRGVILIVSLEGQCEVRLSPTPQQLGKTRNSGVIGSPTDVSPLTIVSQFTIPANCTCGDLDASGDYLYLGSSDRRVYVFHMKRPNYSICIGSVFLQSQVFSLKAFDWNGFQLLLVGSTTHIVLLDVESSSVANWGARRVETESSEATGTDEDIGCPSLRPLWSYRFERDVEQPDSGETDAGANRQGGFTRSLRAGAAVYNGGQGRPAVSKNTRLPVAVDCVSSGNQAHFVALTEDGYMWLFHLEECSNEGSGNERSFGVATLGEGSSKRQIPALSIRFVWKPTCSMRFFRSMIQRVALQILPDNNVRAVALAMDGTCFMMDSGRHAVMTQLRPEVCSFFIQQRALMPDHLLLVCVSAEEVVEYTVVPGAVGVPIGTESVSWGADDRKLLLDVGRKLFPDFAELSITSVAVQDELIRKTELLCCSAFTDREWDLIAQLEHES